MIITITTRAGSKLSQKVRTKPRPNDVDGIANRTNMDKERKSPFKFLVPWLKLMREQNADTELKDMLERNKLKGSKPLIDKYFGKNGIFMRRWNLSNKEESEDWIDIEQVIVPRKYWHYILKIAYELPLVGHLSIMKTRTKSLDISIGQECEKFLQDM